MVRNDNYKQGLTLPKVGAAQVYTYISFGCCCSFRKVFAFDFDLATGSVTNKRVAVQVDPEFGVCSFVRFHVLLRIGSDQTGLFSEKS